MGLTATTEEIIAAIRAEAGNLPKAAARLGCAWTDMIDVGLRQPGIAQAIQEEKQRANDLNRIVAASLPAMSDDMETLQVWYVYEGLRDQQPQSEIFNGFSVRFPGMLALTRAQLKKLFRMRVTAAAKILKEDAEATNAISKYQCEATALKIIRDETAYRHNPNTHNANVLKAVDMIAKLRGHYAVVKTALTDPTGEKAYEPLTDEQRAERISVILDAARARRDRQTAGSDKDDAPADV